jgi:LuxR family maltose regulon positive regulatory protein
MLRYLIAALHTVAPGLCAEVEPLLAVPTLPPAAYIADALVAALLALREPVVLVLDDYHAVRSEAVHTLLVRLVQQLPAAVHLVILTRIDPPWPLARWRVRQWLREVRAADLSFSLEEAQEFFRHHRGPALAADTVAMLHQRTEGWIAGLQLAQVSLATADDPEEFARSFSASDHLIVDFLMDEVLTHQTPEMQTFLLLTSLLERFCAPLCDVLLAEVSQPQHSVQLLARLERANLFVVALDSTHSWYRYHHLFRELLVHHLQRQVAPPRLSHLHRRAGEWFAHEGLIEEALCHFLAAGEVDVATALVEHHFRTLIDDGVHSGRDLEHWIALFPPAVVSQRPALLVAQAYQHLFQWDYRRIEALLDQVEVLLRDPACVLADTSRQRLRGDIATIYGSCLYQKGDLEGVVRHARRTRQVRSRENGFTYLAYALSGRREEALRLLAQDFAADAAQGSRHAGRLLTMRMIVAFYAGDLAAVEQSAQQQLALHDTVPIPDWWRSYGHYFLGHVAYERNLLDTTAAHLARVEALPYRVNPLLYHDSLLGLALIAQARGEADALRHYTAVARTFARKSQSAFVKAASETFTLRLHLYTGDRSGTLPTHAPPLDTNQFWFESPALTLAEYLVSTASAEDVHAAFTAVADGLQRAQQHHHTRQIIAFQAVHALALHRTGRRKEAGSVLDQALHMAEPLGLVRTFVDRGPLMAELLQASVHRHPRDPYRCRLVQAFGRCQPSDSGTMALEDTSPGATTAGEPAAATPYEALTNREVDVLRMLEERLSNKEIAARLFVSAETVKKHTLSLYRKLHVHTRRQAVATARQRRLLSSD